MTTTELHQPPTGRVETYKFKQVVERTRVRLDGQPWSKLRVTAAYIWNPIWEKGDVPTFASAFNIPAGTSRLDTADRRRRLYKSNRRTAKLAEYHGTSDLDRYEQLVYQRPARPLFS